MCLFKCVSPWIPVTVFKVLVWQAGLKGISCHLILTLCTPAPCALPRRDQRPTLAELQSIIVDGEVVSIIRNVADNWKNLCVAFNFDPNGRQLKIIEQRYPNRAEECSREMFQTWLKVQGVTWSSLIAVLESCDEAVIAEKVKAYVGIGAQQKGNYE